MWWFHIGQLCLHVVVSLLVIMNLILSFHCGLYYSFSCNSMRCRWKHRGWLAELRHVVVSLLVLLNFMLRHCGLLYLYPIDLVAWLDCERLMVSS